MQTSLLSTFIVALILTSGKVTGESANKGRLGIDAEGRKREVNLNNNLRSRQANTARNGSIRRASKAHEEWQNIGSFSNASSGHGKEKAVLLKDSAIDYQKSLDTAKAKRFMSGCTDKKVEKAKRTKKIHSDGREYQSWHDSDGKKYDCAYYAQDDNCVSEGDDYEHFGFTANQACCVCGGGGVINENLNHPPVNAPVGVPLYHECTNNPAHWNDNDGNDCDHYYNNDLCESSFDAKKACCWCGGGKTCQYEGSSTEPLSCHDNFTATAPTIDAGMTSPTEAPAPTGPNANSINQPVSGNPILPTANGPVGIPLYRECNDTPGNGNNTDAIDCDYLYDNGLCESSSDTKKACCLCGGGETCVYEGSSTVPLFCFDNE